MSDIIPNSRPQQARDKSLAILQAHGIADAFGLIGVRGYYRDTMGVPGKNDRGIYDDAIMLVTPDNYTTFNANVDPSVARQGIASIKPGNYLYKIGIHGLSKPPAKRYKALVQAGPVTVVRDGGKMETGYFGINIHHGSIHGTSSLGCQTIIPGQWDGFITLVEHAMKKYGHETIPYILTENV